MAYILLLSAGVICSICFQANAQCTTPERTGNSEGIDEILVTTNAVWRVCVQGNEQCTTSACEDSSAETDETELQENFQTPNETLVYAIDERLNATLDHAKESNQSVEFQELQEKFQTPNETLSSAIDEIDERLNATLDHVKESNQSVEFQELQEKFQTSNETLSFAIDEIDERLNGTLDHVKESNQSVEFQELQENFQTPNETLAYTIDEIDERLNATLDHVKESNQSLEFQELQEKFQTPNETLAHAIDKIDERLNATLDHVKENNQSLEFQAQYRSTSDVYDCSDVKANGYTTSGVYRIYVVDQGQRYYANAFCDMTTTNGPWTIFQRRKDGSVDFHRGWSEYASGFGNSIGEFWLGNNFMHFLTSKRRYRLRIDLEDFEGGKRYAEYSSFNISSSADKYRLRIGTYSGNAEDSLGSTYHNGQQFSTKDDDNDESSSYNLAVMYHAAWWYSTSYYSKLNGLYLRGRYTVTSCSPTCWEGIEWYGWRGYAYSLKTTEMKISSL